jgi:ribosomal protein S27AE
MSEGLFKYKPDKLKNQKKIVTLDETHRSYIKKFDNDRNNLAEKKQYLISLTKQLNDILNKNQSNLSLEDIKQKTLLKEEINNLNKFIYDTEHHKTELEYYSKINDVLLGYYDMSDNNENVSSIEATTQIFSQQPQIRKRSRNIPTARKDILLFFSEQKPQKHPITNLSTQLEKNHPLLSRNKAYLREQYMKAINSEGPVKRIYNTTKLCEKCGIERTLVQTDGTYVCGICGEVENALIESDIPNYRDNVSEKPSYPYKRVNHLTELKLIILFIKN